MIVIFISQCEKKALKRTRRILDSFASRIGNRTWQTIITNEGVKTVRQLLRKHATKNTAVSCHWIRGGHRTELLWIVGNRNKFDANGIVPIGITKRNILKTEWENDWYYLSVIKSLCAVSALFHDLGKASLCFQKKLKGENPLQDPFRHEWISYLIFKTYVLNANKEKSDINWLTRLAHGDIDTQCILHTLRTDVENIRATDIPRIAEIVSWLILTHHKLPIAPKPRDWREEPCPSLQVLCSYIESNWGYSNDTGDLGIGTPLSSECFTFNCGLPTNSKPWLKEVKKWSSKMIDAIPLIDQSINDDCWLPIVYHAKLSLMLGDYYFSSQGASLSWDGDNTLYANTDRETGLLKQKLDEHLIGVEKNALHVAHLLPFFESEPPAAYDVRALSEKAPMNSDYYWQDRAVSKIAKQRDLFAENQKNRSSGGFIVNMASTGCGKTHANAKVMQALSAKGETLRFIMALGLRTLTLQTGDVYREKIGLDESELAVIIGSKAITALHNKGKSQQEGRYSESIESLIDNDVKYDCEIPFSPLSTIIKGEKDRKFLYAPVLVCTIDHIIRATETKRGGKWLLPYLRLLSSDLVIDEVDDFMGEDLIAIGRLIHLAGMLGRKVMISSATITPDIAEGYFHAYKEGWKLFYQTRNASNDICCAWIDEFTTHTEIISASEAEDNENTFSMVHHKFGKERVAHLRSAEKKYGVPRKGDIVLCDNLHKVENQAERIQKYFHMVQHAIIHKHSMHHIIDKETNKKVSFGLVRTAHINPCIELSKYLLQADWPNDIDIKVLTYHSRMILLLRNEIECNLDAVLNRSGDNERKMFSNPIIRKHLMHTKSENVIFIVVATPVEEIGRDHDFDWAIVEPSSYRSIIQLAGRVRRHRKDKVTKPNISLMQYNIKSISGDNNDPVFCYPGYESSKNKLETHNLLALMDEKTIGKSINAVPRITYTEPLNFSTKLADLEHHVLSSLLTAYDQRGPESLEGSLGSYGWNLTGMPQSLNTFRAGEPSIQIYLVYCDGVLRFEEKDKNGEFVPIEFVYQITHYPIEPAFRHRLWLELDYQQLLEKREDLYGEQTQWSAKRYGIIEIPKSFNDNELFYSDQFGMSKKIKDRG